MTFLEKALDDALREFADAGHDGDVIVEAIGEEMQRNPMMRRELNTTLRTLIIMALPRAREKEIMERGLCEQQASVTANGTAASPPAPSPQMAGEGNGADGTTFNELYGYWHDQLLGFSYLQFAPAPELLETSPETRFSELQHAHSEAILENLMVGKKPLMSMV